MHQLKNIIQLWTTYNITLYFNSIHSGNIHQHSRVMLFIRRNFSSNPSKRPIDRSLLKYVKSVEEYNSISLNIYFSPSRIISYYFLIKSTISSNSYDPTGISIILFPMWNKLLSELTYWGIKVGIELYELKLTRKHSYSSFKSNGE